MTKAYRERYIADLVAQIARDLWTLDHDPTPAPSPEFYQQRISDYHDEVLRVRGDE